MAKGASTSKAPEKAARPAEAKKSEPKKADDKKPLEPKAAEAKPAESKAEAKPAVAKGGGEANRTDERWDLSPQEINYRIGETVKGGHLRDVSDSGCRIEHLNEQPRIGANVELEIPGKIGPIGRVRVKGVVRWVKPGRDDWKQFGISFGKGQGEAIRKLLYAALVND